MDNKFVKYILSLVVLGIGVYISSSKILQVAYETEIFRENIDELLVIAPNVNLSALFTIGIVIQQLFIVIAYTIGLKITMDLNDESDEPSTIFLVITIAFSCTSVISSFRTINYDATTATIILNQILFSIVFATITFLIFKIAFKKVYRKSIIILFSLYTIVNIIIAVFAI